MKKKRNILTSPIILVGILVLAGLMLVVGTIGGTRAALNIQSENFDSEIELSGVKVQLVENGIPLEKDPSKPSVLMQNLLPKGENLKPDTVYDEELAVLNSGADDEFVRVTVYKYWEDADGKRPDMDSDWIHLGFVTDNGWMIDEQSSTPERTVLYYNKALVPDEKSKPFLASVSVDGKVTDKVTQTETTVDGLTTIVTTYDYDGTFLKLLAYVDAVQTHNAQQAIKSAWGKDVTISGNNLSLD